MKESAIQQKDIEIKPKEIAVKRDFSELARIAAMDLDDDESVNL